MNTIKSIFVDRNRARKMAMCLMALFAGIFFALGVGNIKASAASDFPQISITLTEGCTWKELNSSQSNEASGLLTFSADGISGEYILKNIHGRGQSSWTGATKKGFSIKVETLEGKKPEFIEGAGAAKGWNLIACGVESHDTTFLNNMVGMKLYEQLGGSSALKFRMVELTVNGEYQGVYMLTEKVQINSERIDIAEPGITVEEGSLRTIDSGATGLTAEEQAVIDYGISSLTYHTGAVVNTTGGFVIEASAYYRGAGSSVCGFTTRRGSSFELKDPDEYDLAQMTRIAEYVQDFEDALFSDSGCNAKGQYYTDFVDLSSLAKLFAVNLFVGNTDFFFSSTYFYSELGENGVISKLSCGPIWDLNYYHFINCIEPQRQFFDSGAVNWISEFYEKGDFMAELSKQAELLKPLTVAMNAKSGTDTVSAYITLLSEPMKRNDTIWKTGFSQKAQDYKTAFSSHVTGWNAFWENTEMLFSASAGYSGCMMEVNAIGTAEAYQWYRVNTDGTITEVNGATGNKYAGTPGERYICRVYGDTAVKSYNDYDKEERYISTPVITAKGFDDVQSNDYFSEPVRWALNHGITSGADASHFSPNANTTRAQMVTFLWRAYGSPEPAASECPFTDVEPGAYYEKAVLWAVEQGITSGTSDTAFSPDSPVTRAQTVTFMYRAAGSLGLGISISAFDDVPTDAYYADAVLWAASTAITSGTSATTFSPDAICTRAQVVTFLSRSIK